MFLTPPAAYLTSDTTSFAYISARDRWPVIIVCPLPRPLLSLLTAKTGAIDDVHRAVTNLRDEAKRDEGKRIIEKLATLKYELQHNRQLTPLEGPDTAAYNTELQQLGTHSWFNVPWLYAECYLYRYGHPVQNGLS